MTVSIEEVRYISNLCKINFSDEEIKSFAKEFEEILNYFNYLNELDLNTKNVSDTQQDIKPIVRKDKVIKNSCDDLFSNVKSMKDNYIKVPKIIE